MTWNVFSSLFRFCVAKCITEIFKFQKAAISDCCLNEAGTRPIKNPRGLPLKGWSAELDLKYYNITQYIGSSMAVYVFTMDSTQIVTRFANLIHRPRFKDTEI